MPSADGRAHVIGAGLAGLAAALSLTEAGWAVTLYESGPAAGGRCRSYFDRALGCRIDNGNHLLLSGNRATFAFLDQVGSRHTMAGPARPIFPFMDLASGERWTLRPNMGRLPWWLFSPGRRVPGMRLRHMLALATLSRAPADATVADRVPDGALYRRLVEPLAIAALNTMPDAGSARLLGAVVDETLAAGGRACVPAFPKEGLSETFIDPAITWLTARGATLHTGCRITALENTTGRVTALHGPEAPIPVGPDDRVVLATPAPVAADLLPGLSVPTEFEAIANLHFRYDHPPTEAGFIGLIGGITEWVFIKSGVVSVTISAANRHAIQQSGDLAATVWREVSAALNLPRPQAVENDMASLMPPYRLVREKRATFAATPAQDRLRPPARTGLENLVLAGDWTATGLPATIEGAIRSGREAALKILETA